MSVVLIVEDLRETRIWLAEIARAAFPDCRIVEAASVREAMLRLGAEQFDIALIDLGLQDGSGLDVLRRLRQDQPRATCIVTTVMGDDASIVGALSAGAQGYLLKEQARELLVRQLTDAVGGVPALSPSVARRIMEHFRRTGPNTDDTALTAREREVLALVGRGLRNSEVAQNLQLSDHTVAGYIKSIYRKLDISSRAEASWHAARLGLRDRSR